MNVWKTTAGVIRCVPTSLELTCANATMDSPKLVKVDIVSISTNVLSTMGMDLVKILAST